MVEAIISEAKPGDVLLTLGAGDVYKMGEEILERLEHEIRNPKSETNSNDQNTKQNAKKECYLEL
jgi:hypothetical protein